MRRTDAPPPRAVQLLVTCLVDHLYPRVGLAAAEVLERAGIEVLVPDGQTCCGQPAFNAGCHDDARRMARHTVDVLTTRDALVVIPSGSCTDMLVHHAPALLADDPDYGPRAAALAGRTYELTQFLVDVLGSAACGGCAREPVTYHPSCHGLRGLGVRDQPLALLDAVGNIDRRPLPDAEACCGFGGLFSVKMSAISGAMLDRKLDAIEASGARTVVATDVSCLMHIAGGLRRRGTGIGVKHLAEVLAEPPDTYAVPGPITRDESPDGLPDRDVRAPGAER
jgi:L-lactate dehydrogenase complex protein LldE